MEPPSLEYLQDVKLKLCRSNRKQLLEDSDKYLLSDFPLSEEQRNTIKIYRQELRDYFTRDEVQNWKFTFKDQYPPNFPTKPDFMK
jgi:hypothetical protein